MYQRNQWLFTQLKTMGLSIDGCTKHTYEILRRGGRFEMLQKNLDSLREIKKQHNFELVFHCVIQKNNFREMEKYVKFATDHGADRIWFNRIVDWKTLDNFKDHDVADTAHPLNAEFKKHLDSIRKYAWSNGRKFVEFPTLDIL